MKPSSEARWIDAPHPKGPGTVSSRDLLNLTDRNIITQRTAPELQSNHSPICRFHSFPEQFKFCITVAGQNQTGFGHCVGDCHMWHCASDRHRAGSSEAWVLPCFSFCWLSGVCLLVSFWYKFLYRIPVKRKVDVEWFLMLSCSSYRHFLPWAALQGYVQWVTGKDRAMKLTVAYRDKGMCDKVAEDPGIPRWVVTRALSKLLWIHVKYNSYILGPSVNVNPFNSSSKVILSIVFKA